MSKLRSIKRNRARDLPFEVIKGAVYTFSEAATLMEKGRWFVPEQHQTKESATGRAQAEMVDPISEDTIGVQWVWLRYHNGAIAGSIEGPPPAVEAQSWFEVRIRFRCGCENARPDGYVKTCRAHGAD